MSGFLGGGVGPVALKRRRAAAADWWQVAGQTCVAAYQPIGAASLAASYVNLANPGTYNAAPGTAPTLAAGWSFNGSTQYLTTGVVPPTSQDWSIAMRFSGRNTSGFQGSGSYGGSFGFLFDASNNYYFNGSQLVIAPTLISGVVAVAGVIGYRNGAPESGTILNDGSKRRGIYLGALNTSTGANYFQSGTIAAVAIYSTTLSAADVAALTTRMQALA